MRSRLVSAFLAMALAVASGIALVAAPAAPAAAAAPKCTFNGSSLPIVTGIATGKTIEIACTGLAPLHPYLLFEASLLIGIDPQAKALLSGNSGLSPLLFKAALATVQKINPGTITALTTDLSGNLGHTFTQPSTQPTDPNASCPPTRQQFNSGLLGCALALLDLTTQKPVGAGSAVVEFAGFPLLPPQPTVAVTTPKARAGKVVSITDRPGNTTYWWVPTLGALNSMLSGDTTQQKVTVTVGSGVSKKVALSYAGASAATYTKPTFTPPKLSGIFVMPKGLPKGDNVVTVTLVQPLLGLPLANVATTTIKRV